MSIKGSHLKCGVLVAHGQSFAKGSSLFNLFIPAQNSEQIFVTQTIWNLFTYQSLTNKDDGSNRERKCSQSGRLGNQNEQVRAKTRQNRYGFRSGLASLGLISDLRSGYVCLEGRPCVSVSGPASAVIPQS